MMDSRTGLPTVGGNLSDVLEGVVKFVDKDSVIKLIDLQVSSIDRLESTNKSLVNCNKMAQSKLATTSSLFKKTSKQISDSKKDLDIIYKKILELKAKLRLERPDLFKETQENSAAEETYDSQPVEANDPKRGATN